MQPMTPKMTAAIHAVQLATLEAQDIAASGAASAEYRDCLAVFAEEITELMRHLEIVAPVIFDSPVAPVADVHHGVVQ